MTSLLFQPASSKGSSSSASGLNPFQTLTHFYEQELTDAFIDSPSSSSSSSSSSSRHFRQQTHHQQQQQKQVRGGHLFPSSSSTWSSSTSSTFSSGQYTKGKPHSNYTHHQPPPALDEFRLFSNNNANPSSFQTNISNAAHASGGHGADISEYLKQRQEYYAREARLRSLDRNDGLGPILDFSFRGEGPLELFHESKHPHSSHADKGKGLWHHHPHRNQDHDHLRHGDRQTVALGEGSQRMRASSQQEQVLMDLAQGAAEAEAIAVASQGWEQAWQDSTSTLTQHRQAPSQQLQSMRTPTVDHATSRAGISGGSLASTFMNAAASLPSSWPLAPWAVETEAALMEFQTLYKDYGQLPQEEQGGRILTTRPQELDQDDYDQHYLTAWEARAEEQDAEWAKEFSETSFKDVGVQPIDHQATARRGSVVKTCGYMLDSRHHNSEQELLDAAADAEAASGTLSLVDPTTSLAPAVPLVAQAMEATASSALQDHHHGHGPRYGHPILVNSAPISTAMMNPTLRRVSFAAEQEEPSFLRVKDLDRSEGYNDDVFEGDMLQAWMETLAQEKLEAEEKAQETAAKEVEVIKVTEEGSDPVKDRLVLEMALRRLNALMHQLGRTSGHGTEGGQEHRREEGKGGDGGNVVSF